MVSALPLVVAAVVGALLNSLGAYLNDHFAQRRETRQAEREAEARRQEWEREDRIRREQIEQEDREKRRQQRAKVYKAFMRATTIPTASESANEALSVLNESLVELQLHATENVSDTAEKLHGLVYAEIEGTKIDHSRHAQIEQVRAEFLSDVREEG